MYENKLYACFLRGNLFSLYVDPCKAKPCKFGGRCFELEDSDDGGFVCECPPGHEGETCEISKCITK